MPPRHDPLPKGGVPPRETPFPRGRAPPRTTPFPRGRATGPDLLSEGACLPPTTPSAWGRPTDHDLLYVGACATTTDVVNADSLTKRMGNQDYERGDQLLLKSGNAPLASCYTVDLAVGPKGRTPTPLLGGLVLRGVREASEREREHMHRVYCAGVRPFKGTHRRPKVRTKNVQPTEETHAGQLREWSGVEECERV